MMKMALERVGFRIDVFNDPVLALKNYKPDSYDLVILDVIMQKMNGFELYNQFRQMDPDIKVCFLTASSEDYRKEIGRCELNKDLFLNMPLPLRDFLP